MRRIVIDNPPWAPADLVISGEISRMDIVPTRGYAAWLFRNNDVQDWHRELRMPLIQEALALEMSVPVEEVMVGVYGFQRQVVDQRTYSLGETRSAYTITRGPAETARILRTSWQVELFVRERRIVKDTKVGQPSSTTL